MIVIDAIGIWLDQNGVGIAVGLVLWIILLGTIAYHVEHQNNFPRK